MAEISDLDDLLRSDGREADAWACQQLDHSRPIVLIGAGRLGMRLVKSLLRHRFDVVAIADNDPEKCGTEIDGILVSSLAEATGRHGASAQFVVSIFSPGHPFSQLHRQLLELGCKTILPVVTALWSVAEDLLPYYPFHQPSKTLDQRDDIRRAFLLLTDQASRDNFLGHLRLRLRGDFLGQPHWDGESQYFLPELKQIRDEWFVDCGAYNGDTLQRFRNWTCDHFAKVTAFEPDARNVVELLEHLAVLPPEIQRRVKVEPCATGAQSGLASMMGEGSAAALCESGVGIIQVVTLDEALEGRPTFLKLDVEGAELSTLKGAHQILAAKHPALVVAVCVYHRHDDLWKIPLFLAKYMRSDDTVLLRSHEADELDTVLYVIPKSRLK